MTSSLSLYVHIPFCAQKCSYCDFAAYERLEDYMDTYVDALGLELELYGKALERPVLETIYFGGGTPTHMSVEQLEKIFYYIHRYFECHQVQEVTMESNPGEVDYIYLEGLRTLGVNRLSFGVQTLDDTLLQLLRRTHTASQAYSAVEDAARAGFKHINADFIYGLPYQSLDDLAESLRFIKHAPIDHVSIYGLQLESGSYLKSLVSQGKLILPEDALREEMYEYMIATCEDNGFARYEISNFAKQEAYGYHNLRYWRGEHYVGVGAGAHGYLGNTRYGNTPYIVPYLRKVECYEYPRIEEEVVDETAAAEETCFLGLRTKWGIDIQAYNMRFGTSFWSTYRSVVEKLVSKGLIEVVENHVRLTHLGTAYGNYVCSEFLQELDSENN